MNKQYQTIAIVIFALLLGTAYFYTKKNPDGEIKPHIASEAMAAKFDYLSQNGNSSCSANFQKSIPEMADADHIRGSCCSPMSMHRYSEQVEGLKKYVSIKEIPPDPYDIEAGLAKKLMSYYEMELTPDEQTAYHYAMANSHEKGPCCCKCWRWYVYGGLGKYLIRNYGFTGEQLTEVWDLSDGCGGDDEHHH
jgi:hypothetical protein